MLRTQEDSCHISPSCSLSRLISPVTWIRNPIFSQLYHMMTESLSLQGYLLRPLCVTNRTIVSKKIPSRFQRLQCPIYLIRDRSTNPRVSRFTEALTSRRVRSYFPKLAARNIPADQFVSFVEMSFAAGKFVKNSGHVVTVFTGAASRDSWKAIPVVQCAECDSSHRKHHRKAISENLRVGLIGHQITTSNF